MKLKAGSTISDCIRRFRTSAPRPKEERLKAEGMPNVFWWQKKGPRARYATDVEADVLDGGNEEVPRDAPHNAPSREDADAPVGNPFEEDGGTPADDDDVPAPPSDTEQTDAGPSPPLSPLLPQTTAIASTPESKARAMKALATHNPKLYKALQAIEYRGDASSAPPTPDGAASEPASAPETSISVATTADDDAAADGDASIPPAVADPGSPHPHADAAESTPSRKMRQGGILRRCLRTLAIAARLQQ